MAKKREGFEIVRVGLILFAITAVAALVLAYVNKITSPIIAEQETEKMQAAMAEVLPAADEFEEIPLEPAGESVLTKVYKTNAGFVVFAAPNGYGGEITMAIGIDEEFKVAGISIISQSETAGLGANCMNKEWQNQFIGKTDEIKVVKNGANDNQIDAISSATITSKAVTKAVNEAITVAKILGGEE